MWLVVNKAKRESRACSLLRVRDQESIGSKAEFATWWSTDHIWPTQTGEVLSISFKSFFANKLPTFKEQVSQTNPEHQPPLKSLSAAGRHFCRVTFCGNWRGAALQFRVSPGHSPSCVALAPAGTRDCVKTEHLWMEQRPVLFICAHSAVCIS